MTAVSAGTSSAALRDLAYLAAAGYQDTFTGQGATLEARLAASGWTLRAGESLTPTDGQFAGAGSAQGYFVHENAAGFVAEKDGVLVIVFRGSDDNADFLDAVFDQEGHYALLQPLVLAALAYAQAEGIETVQVAGHSLGGIMAEWFASEASTYADSAGIAFTVATFGSPGTDPLTPSSSLASEVVSIQHSGDGLTGLNFTHDGQVVVVERDGADQHSSLLYLDTMARIAASPLGDAFAADAGAYFIALGDAGVDRFPADLAEQDPARALFALGASGGDSIAGTSGGDLIDGGSGDDLLRGGAGSDQLEGGAGLDTALFELSRASYTPTWDLDGTLRISAAGHSDSLRGVEVISFGDWSGSLADYRVWWETRPPTSTVEIAAQAASAREGNGGSLLLTFVVSLDAAQSGAQSLRYSVAGIGANPAAASDFVGGAFPSGSVTFAAGETSKTITVAVAGDSVYEANESFRVILTDPSDGLVIGQATALGTILNDDALSLTAGNNSWTGGAEDDWVRGLSGNDRLQGNGGHDLLDGGANVDVLIGNSGHDTLNGGSGIDSLYGGSGNDLYLVDTATDRVTDVVNGGYDTVQSNLSFTLGAEIEALVLGGSAAINGFGNNLANVIQGNGANNTLDGRAGADTLAGGSGNDVYYLDSLGDRVVEAQGLDIVRAQVNGLGLFAGVEVLQLQTGVAWGSGSSGAESLYGNAGANTLFGGSGADLLDGSSGGDSLYGGSGNDTFTLDTGTDRAFGGDGSDTVRASANTTLGGGIENLVLLGTAKVGTGDAGGNAITGNNQANTLLGNSGADTLNGGSGIDSLYGGSGNDLYLVDTATDRVTDVVNGGYDTVQAALSFTLGAEIEALILGGAAAINGFGNSAANYIQGNGGNNTLDGKAGADTLAGGSGNDVYYLDNLGDTVVETQGLDIARAQVNGLTLQSGIEALQLQTGVLWGNGSGGADSLYGNAGVNTLFGGSGADLLDGSSGGDSLYGGSGNDSFVTDTASDRAYGGAGFDTVRASANATLGGGIESLLLLGTAKVGVGDAAANTITGNNQANTLLGNSGADTLNGGSGIDSLYGGSGNDLYLVDTATDRVTDVVNGGYDTIRSSVNVTLGAEIEQLVLTGSAARGLGNALDNAIVGTAGVNTLLGNSGNDLLDGGSGGDSLYGGFGDDTFMVDTGSDRVLESAAQGRDRVMASIAYSLGGNLEDLVLTGGANLNGLGNALDNALWGNEGANSLAGFDGADTLYGAGGGDSLVGGSGADLAYGGAGNDSVTGDAGNDTLYGGSGADTLNGGAGDDSFDGGSGNDTYVVDTVTDMIADAGGIDWVRAQAASFNLATGLEHLVFIGAGSFVGIGNALANSIAGGSGVDSLYGGSGGDWLFGGSGADLLAGGSGGDTLSGGSGGDTYMVTEAGDLVVEGDNLPGSDRVITTLNSYALATYVEVLQFNGAGNFVGTGNALANTLIGGAGNDTLDGGEGADSFAGGSGNDTYVLSTGESVVENPGGGIDEVRLTGTTFALSVNVENLVFLGNSNVIGVGNALGNSISAGSGADSLFGGLGDDVLNGGGGFDTLQGDSGNDVLRAGSGFARLYGGSGNDTLFAGTGTGAVYGNTGNDTLYAGSTDFANGGSGNDVVSGFGDLDGREGNDTLFATATRLGDSQLVYGGLGDGNDTIYATASGATHIATYGGNDWIDLGAADNNYDRASGGSGSDTFVVYEAIDEAEDFGDAGQIDVLLQAGQSLTIGQGIEVLYLLSGAESRADGNAGDDTMISLSAQAIFLGWGSDDLLLGAGQADSLYGGSGADSLSGGGGGDLLWGGGGQDTVFGGAGADTIAYLTASESTAAASDFLADLEAGDTLDLAAIDADSGQGGDQAFSFIGSGAFTNTAGELRMNGTQLEGDTNGDGTADLVIRTTTANPIWSFNF